MFLRNETEYRSYAGDVIGEDTLTSGAVIRNSSSSHKSMSDHLTMVVMRTLGGAAEGSNTLGLAKNDQTTTLLGMGGTEFNDGGVGGGGSSSEVHISTFEQLSVNVLFLCMLIFLGGSVFMTYRKVIFLPYTVVLFLYGIFVGAVALWISPDVANALGSIPPDLLFYVFLPVLIFEGSYAINIHALRRVGVQTALLATIGIVINTCLLSLVVKAVFSSWSWYAAVLLGSLLSATDPVAVVTLLKDIRVEKKLTALLDGEAVMNDSTAIIMFSLLLPAARAGHIDTSVGAIVLKSAQLLLLPVVCGPAFGLLQAFWLRRVNENLTKACVTVSVTYVSYYVAQHLVGTSGVMTLFFEGIFLSYYFPSAFPGRDDNPIYATWEFLVHLGNTVLFSLIGVILVADVVATIRAVDIFIIIAVYLAMVVARLIMFEVLLPLLNCLSSYTLDQKKVLLLVHSGLRGGVAATLALAVRQEGLEEGIQVLKVTSGVVLMTLLINAPTASYVVHYLGFDSKEQYRVMQMHYALEYFLNTEEKALQAAKRDTKYRNANWMSVERFVPRYRRHLFRNITVAPEDDEAALNRLLMSAFKTSLWRQRDDKVISETVVLQLGSILADKLDRGELFSVREMQLYHKNKSNTFNENNSNITNVGSNIGRQRGTGSGAIGSDAAEVIIESDATQQLRSSQAISTSRTTRTEGGADDAAASTTSALSSAAAASSHRSQQRHPHDYVNSKGDDEDDDPPSLPVVISTRFSDSTRSRHNERENSDDETAPSPLLPPSPSSSPPAAAAANDISRLRADALMQRLLPLWVVLAERFFFKKGYFVSAHRRAQENAFMTLLAVVKCLTSLSEIRFKYVRNERQAQRVERWLTSQLADANAAVHFFYMNFPEATNNVASTRVVLSVANNLCETVEHLHAEHGFGLKIADSLEQLIEHMRKTVPQRWDNDIPTKESDLVQRAVAATTLGRGLRRTEIRAISSMGLVRKYKEKDIIRLPENAFLIVVFGTLRAVHDTWTTMDEHELTESFGDTVGLDAFLLPTALRMDQQRQWRVVSSDATALIISFNSIKPFLTERSLRAVKALWRAAAVEVLLPLLENMITLSASDTGNTRERLMSIVRSGTPLIGPRDVEAFDWSARSRFHLCFYLRGSDDTGFFSGHTPPCHVSSFYAGQLKWSDPDVVLYAVPVNVSDNGYVPWNTFTRSTALSASPRDAALQTTRRGAGDGDQEDSDEASDSDNGSGGGGARVMFKPQADGEEGGKEEYSSEGMRAASSRNGRQHGRASIPFLSTATPLGGNDARIEEVESDEEEEMLPMSSTIASGAASATGADELSSVSVPASTSSARALGFGGKQLSIPNFNSSNTGVANYEEAATILSSVLLGRMPTFRSSSIGSEASMTINALGNATTARTCTTSSSNDSLDSSTYLTADVHSVGSPTPLRPSASIMLHLRYTEHTVCILQSLRDFVTPVPYMNVLFAEYASCLEQLCIAAIRYVTHPSNPLDVLHAQRIAYITLEFLLSFGLEVALVKRAARVITRQRGVNLESIGVTAEGDAYDAAFQSKICAWCRHAALTHKHHLKTIILEMNAYANYRFKVFVRSLRQLVQWNPEMKKIETVEGLQQLVAVLVRQGAAQQPQQEAHYTHYAPI